MGKTAILGPSSAKGVVPDTFVRQRTEIDITKYMRKGAEIHTGNFRASCKIEGQPGTGKTVFYMGEAWRARSLGFPPERTLIFVIDFVGGTGITDILRRAIFPPEYIPSVVHFQCPSLAVGDAAIDEFLKMCQGHDDWFIVLAVEGDHKIYEFARDEYVQSTRGKFYDQLVQDACNREVEIHAKNKTVFDESVRDAYSVINPRYTRFIETVMIIAEKFSANIYLTAHLEYVTISFGEPQQLKVLGKPGKIDGYFDNILRTFVVEEVQGTVKNSRFLIDVRKCRQARTFITANNGAYDFWNKVQQFSKAETYESVFKNTVKDGDRLDDTKAR